MSALVPIKLCVTLQACQALASGIAAALAVFSKRKGEKQNVTPAAAEAAAAAAANFLVAAGEQATSAVRAAAAAAAATAAGLGASEVLRLASEAVSADGEMDDAQLQAEVATAVAGVLQVRLHRQEQQGGGTAAGGAVGGNTARPPAGDSLPVVMAACLMENHAHDGAPIVAAGGFDGEKLKELMVQLEKHEPGTEEYEYYRGYMNEIIQTACGLRPLGPKCAPPHSQLCASSIIP